MEHTCRLEQWAWAGQYTQRPHMPQLTPAVAAHHAKQLAAVGLLHEQAGAQADGLQSTVQRRGGSGYSCPSSLAGQSEDGQVKLRVPITEVAARISTHLGQQALFAAAT